MKATEKKTKPASSKKDAKDTRFKPGASGNPNGRPKGSGFVGTAREALQKAWDGELEDGSDGISAKLVEQAKAGEAWAIRLVAERVCPALKPTEPASVLPLDQGTLTDKAAAVFAALGRGELSASNAAQLLTALGGLAKVVEVDEVMKRLDALEQAQKGKA